MKICRMCKYPNDDENNNCKACHSSFEDRVVNKKNTSGSKKLTFLHVVGICILLVVSVSSYFYINQGVSAYNRAVELWNGSDIQAAMDIAREVPESSRKYEDAQTLIQDGQDYFLYSEALTLWNNGDIQEAIKVAKEVSESSDQYQGAQKIIKDGEDYLLYSRGAYLWNVRHYEEALKIFSSFTEDSKYYTKAQEALNKGVISY